MSWNNIMPAWVLCGDKVISDYRKGLIDLRTAENKLDNLCVPKSMKARLYRETDENGDYK